MRCIPTDSAGTTLGVDAHKDFPVALALDALGRRLGTLSIPTTPAGYEKSWWTGRERVRSSGGRGDRRHGLLRCRTYPLAAGRGDKGLGGGSSQAP
jgi:hypothetical protein